MRSEKLIANELLAFLQHQLDVMDEISVMQICTSSFNEDEIRRSKELLYESIEMADRMPTRRRDEKGERSLQDIIKVLKETDPDDVPTFVAKELRKLPPVTFDHVDVTRLLKDITNLKAGLADMQFKLDASQSTISELRTEIVDLRNTIAVCRSHEVSNLNPQSGQLNASKSSVVSAKLTLSTAAVTTRDGPRPTRASSPIAEVTQPAASTTPARAYANVAASRPTLQRQRQTEKPVKALRPSAPKTQVDRDGFIKVERKKKKLTSQNRCGTGPTCNKLLHPAVPTTQVYISRLHYLTKAEAIAQYLMEKLNLNLRVVKLESRHSVNFNSFVARIPTEHLATVTDVNFWPKGVVFRRFRGALPCTPMQRNMSPNKT